MSGTNSLGPIIGVATATKVGSTVTAVINGYTRTVQVARDLTVAANDPLIIDRVGGQWYAVARAYASAPTPPPNQLAPDPQPAIVSGQLVVAPVETRSYRSSGGWRTDTTEVIHGDGGAGNHTGTVFYGSAVQSLSGTTITGATLVVRRISGGLHPAQATTMRLVTETSRPAGAPTLTSTTPGPTLAVGGEDLAFAVPTAWVTSMAAGTAGGIAFFDSDSDPYVVFAGIGAWSPAFTLSINWRRG